VKDRAACMLLTAMSLILFFGVIALVVAIAPHVDLSLGGKGDERATYLALGTLILGVPILTTLAVVLIYTGWCDARSGTPLVRLYWPFLALKLCLLAAFTLLGLRAFDLVQHHLRRTWTALYESEVTVFADLALLGSVICAGWQVMVVMWDRGATPRQVAGPAALMLAMAVLVLAVMWWLAAVA
jgi:hypothetical protein